MKYGMNLLLWSGEVNDTLFPVIEQLKKIGYDGVELPIFNLDLDYASIGKRLDDLGLGRTAVTIRGEDDNPISPDPAARRRGVENNKRTIDACAAAGVETLVGPYHSALGLFSGAGPTQDEWQWGVESMQQTAEYAGKAGVQLAVEWLNRFECYFLNCAANTADFVRAVNHPSCGMMYDSFHANIEEKCIRTALGAGQEKLCHIHISENDRSTPGQGGVNWKRTFDSIADVGYDGWMVVEAFGLALPEIAAATKIWRRMYQDEITLASDSLRFMQTEVSARVAA
jgi:D-psicose/D-tagatose/L-ribulose 3-epimerase